jgi:hypothetical protein
VWPKFTLRPYPIRQVKVKAVRVFASLINANKSNTTTNASRPRAPILNVIRQGNITTLDPRTLVISDKTDKGFKCAGFVYVVLYVSPRNRVQGVSSPD